MRFIEFCKDYGIDYATEHKNVRNNWVGVHCPFCPGKQGYHLGYSLEGDYFNCWRCGGKSKEAVISKLLGVNYARAKEIIKHYGGSTSIKEEESRMRVGTKPLIFPPGNLSLTKHHRHYLEKRNFDPDKIEYEWSIMGTGPSAVIDNISYANRIITPINWEGRLVSWQSRDITNKSEAKYKACPPEREIISHKHIIYGNPLKWKRRGICVEGFTDVWRFGPTSFCTFGIKFTQNQALTISKLFDEVIVVFDPELQAQKNAKKLVENLMGFGIKKAWTEKLPCDPGDLSQDDADHFIKFHIRA